MPIKLVCEAYVYAYPYWMQPPWYKVPTPLVRKVRVLYTGEVLRDPSDVEVPSKETRSGLWLHRFSYYVDSQEDVDFLVSMLSKNNADWIISMHSPAEIERLEFPMLAPTEGGSVDTL